MRTRLHPAVVWGADLPGLLCAPSLGFRDVPVLAVGRVAGGLEPGLADHLGLASIMELEAIEKLIVFFY